VIVVKSVPLGKYCLSNLNLLVGRLNAPDSAYMLPGIEDGITTLYCIKYF